MNGALDTRAANLLYDFGREVSAACSTDSKQVAGIGGRSVDACSRSAFPAAGNCGRRIGGNTRSLTRSTTGSKRGHSSLTSERLKECSLHTGQCGIRHERLCKRLGNRICEIGVSRPAYICCAPKTSTDRRFLRHSCRIASPEFQNLPCKIRFSCRQQADLINNLTLGPITPDKT